VCWLREEKKKKTRTKCLFDKKDYLKNENKLCNLVNEKSDVPVFQNVKQQINPTSLAFFFSLKVSFTFNKNKLKAIQSI
jgi:hypothetical protein